MSMNEDMQLQVAVKLAKQGYAKAFEDLYNLTYKYAFFHAKSILKDENEAWDLVQDTYIVVYQYIGTLKEDRYIKSWIGGIVFNLGHKKLRKKTEVLVGEDDEFLFENIEDRNKDLSPEDALDSKETISIVREVIDSLPALQKAAVIAYYFDEKSIADIADEAMCSTGTIKSRLNYARKAMKDSIERKEREMGVALHTVTGPVIILVLKSMFTQLKVSEQKANGVLALVEKHVGLLGAAGVRTGTTATEGAAQSGSIGTAAITGTAKANAGIFSLLFGTAKMRIVTIILSIAIIGGGIWGVSSVANNNKKADAPVETSVQTEPETEPRPTVQKQQSQRKRNLNLSQVG
ncbi:sigma-70 family RNA polymerase sigma factor [Clostridium sp. AM58-1XD]|uniref:RNA polymerase sigma factor n=1 Tax=Clostridium sp. AM58-1XD TaxID=2292307 RepID=UPI000E4BC426|nr:sigma-70 family RNA polymerase sigma factor [Clostridium sp. AM58-1XD]RGY97043.1 sigma-70 family RNA polymerase sigma factor [Clostridium sp. AM58-1XD]